MARKFAASFSYRVASLRKCLIRRGPRGRLLAAPISELENRALGVLSVDRRRLSNRRLFGFRNDSPLSPLSLAPYSVADDRPQEWPKTAHPSRSARSSGGRLTERTTPVQLGGGNGSKVPHTSVRNTRRIGSQAQGGGDRTHAICIVDTRLTTCICRILKSDAWCPLEGDARLQLA